MKALSQAVLENWLIKHLKDLFPEKCNEFDNVGLRKEIKSGIKRATRYGFEAERDIALYVDLMFMLGRDFDHNIRLPWAEKILNDSSLIDTSLRMDLLYEAAVEYLSKDSVEDLGER